MILAMFIVSMVPLVLAENEGAKSTLSKISTEKGEQVKEQVKEQKEQLKELKEQVKEQLKEQKEQLIEQVGEKKEGVLQKFNEQLKSVPERIKKAQEKREEFEKKSLKAREQHREQNQELTELREKAKCTDNTKECKEFKRGVKTGVKKRLENTLAVITRSFEKLNNHVEESHVLTDTQKDSLATQIAELQKKIDAQVEKVTAMADDATAEELRDAIKETKSVWQETSKLQKRIVARMTNSKLDNLVEKHTEFANGMEARIAELKKQGIDTAELETLLAKFIDQTETLEANQKKSNELYTDAGTVKGELTAWREAQKLVRENLQDTKDTLREFMQTYRDLKPKASDVNEIEDESEDSSEDQADVVESEPTDNSDASNNEDSTPLEE